MEELIGKTLGNYEIEDKIGQGGMAQIFRACQPGLERTVAIKVLSPALAGDPDFTRRFKREARTIASFNHPYIVQVYDFGIQDNYYYLVMRYVKDSRTLSSAIDAGEPVDRLLDYVIQTAEALDYAHRQEITHRDVKPSNILIDERGALLSDFGLVRVGDTASDLTMSGLSIGTPAYMSPEQAMGDEIDYRTDIYSLGIIVFQIFTGHIPHDATTPHGIMVKRSIEPAPSLRETNPNIPASFDQVVQRALAKDPNDRFKSAAEFAAALKRAQQDLFYQEVGEATMPDESTVRARGDSRAGSRARTGSAASAPVDAGLLQGSTDLPRLSGLPVAETGAGGKRPWLMIVGVAVALLIVGAVLALQLLGGDDGQEGLAQAGTPVQTSVSTDVPAVILVTEAPVVATATSGSGAVTATPVADEATPLPTTMVRIPAGVYQVGLAAAGASYAPVQPVELDAFSIDLYEVTNAEYASFIAETGRPVPAGWPDGIMPAGQENHPVEGIDWDAAAAYCAWAHKRLPSEAEWEVVARGAVDWLYPWGDEQDAVALPRSGTYPVGSVSGNRSPFGAYDMAGNVWEWVGDPYAPVTEGHRVLRGGAHGFLKDMAFRLHGNPTIPTMFATAGVRCAAD